MELEKRVAAVIAANNGRLTGRVRLQKTMYLLDLVGFQSELDFEYHHYGPFSDELASVIEDAKAISLIKEEQDFRQSDGVRYSIFTTEHQEISEEAFGTLGIQRAREVLAKLNSQSSTILELAATAHWIHVKEQNSQWRDELVKRKGLKASVTRIDKALDLLSGLGFSLQ